jgi:hypothetical protein
VYLYSAEQLLIDVVILNNILTIYTGIKHLNKANTITHQSLYNDITESRLAAGLSYKSSTSTIRDADEGVTGALDFAPSTSSSSSGAK